MASLLAIERPCLIETAPRGFMHAAYASIIVLQMLYIFTFNWQLELRLPLSSALAAAHVGLAALTLVMRPATWHKFFLLSFALTVLTVIPPHFMGFAEVRGIDFAELIRRLVLPLIMIWILSYPLALPVRILWCVALLGTLYGVFIVNTEPPLYYNINDPGPRFPSITGGIEHVHPSAKLVALQIVLIDLLRRGRFMHAYLAYGLIGLCVYLLLGYGARTQFVFVLVYFGAIMLFRYRRIVVVRWLPFLGLVLLITAATVALSVGTNIGSWGSGRIGTWLYRLQHIADRDLVTLLFGGGIGADDMWTPQWGWGEDTLISHNDYLYFLTDHGIVGLLIPAFFVAALWIRLPDLGRAVVLAVVVSAFFDNGYFRTPMLSAYLAIVFATSIMVTLHLQTTAATAGEDATRLAGAEPGEDEDVETIGAPDGVRRAT